MAKIKHPTPEELADYRRKAETGEHIGKNQLAQVFMQLDKHASDAEKARELCGEMRVALYRVGKIVEAAKEIERWQNDFTLDGSGRVPVDFHFLNALLAAVRALEAEGVAEDVAEEDT